jgi:hypothetical protein
LYGFEKRGETPKIETGVRYKDISPALSDYWFKRFATPVDNWNQTLGGYGYKGAFKDQSKHEQALKLGTIFGICPLT